MLTAIIDITEVIRDKTKNIHAVGARIEVTNAMRDPTVAVKNKREHRPAIIA
jgi:hypothetical protein